MWALKNIARVAVVLVVGTAVLVWMLLPDTLWRIEGVVHKVDVWDSPSEREGLCQYAVNYEEQTLAKGGDLSVAGTTINITSLVSGRLGNHFTIASRFLSLGYCCKAKLVTLPPKDHVLAPGMFGKGSPGPRHFNFSNALDVPGFNSSSECAADYTPKDGETAYRAFLPQKGRPYGSLGQEALATCVKSVRLMDCEAAYYFPKSLRVCRARPRSSSSVTRNASLSGSGKGGNLVIHVRSGDVFRAKKAYGSYGQPPLSYYVTVINSREWDRVDVVTHGVEKSEKNPVVPALQLLADAGTWSRMDFNIHVDRSIEVDLQAMLCADALATARSTLGELTMYHTRAKTVFLPSTCEGYGSAFGHTPGHLIAARSLQDESFEVYGMKLKPEAAAYKVYEATIFTQKERLEMLEYPGLAGMKKCTSSDKPRQR